MLITARHRSIALRSYSSKLKHTHFWLVRIRTFCFSYSGCWISYCASVNVRPPKNKQLTRSLQSSTLIYLFYFLSRIKHENIIALEETFETPAKLYLVMTLWVDLLNKHRAESSARFQWKNLTQDFIRSNPSAFIQYVASWQTRGGKTNHWVKKDKLVCLWSYSCLVTLQWSDTHTHRYRHCGKSPLLKWKHWSLEATGEFKVGVRKYFRQFLFHSLTLSPWV